MTIKHLIIGGGGPGGFINYGIIKKSNLEGIWIYDNIESIYCTSMGSLIGLISLFNIDWSWSDDFLIKRPWNKLVNFNTNDYLRVIKQKGLFDIELMKTMLEPLLKSVDLNINSTLLDLYNLFPKEYHCFTCNINTSDLLELEDLSYKTHPDLSIIEAIFMSSSIPLLAKPICKDNKCYLDGGFLANVPINECLKNTKCNLNEIFGAKYYKPYIAANIQDNSSTWNYFFDLIQNLACKLIIQNEKYQNQEVCIVTGTSNEKPLGEWKYWVDVLNSEQERNDLVNIGENSLLEYLDENKEIILRLKLNVDNSIKHNLKYYKSKNTIIKRSFSF